MANQNSFLNFFSVFNNGLIHRKDTIIQWQRSKTIINLLNLFIEKGFIRSYKFSKKMPFPIKIFLKYNAENHPSVWKIKQISKPGSKIYLPYRQLVQNHYHIIILSTPKGFLTSNDAKRMRLGGEVICKLWLHQ